MLGMLIGGGYAAVEKLALKTYDSVVAALDDVGVLLDTMADRYERAEDAAEGTFSGIAGQL
jgi:hypothetical protein